MLMKLPMAAMIPLAIGCAGCSGTPRVEIGLPEASLTHCTGEERPPTPDLPNPGWHLDDVPPDPEVYLVMRNVQDARDLMLRDFIKALDLARADCASKVAGLRAWRKKAAGN